MDTPNQPGSCASLGLPLDTVRRLAVLPTPTRDSVIAALPGEMHGRADDILTLLSGRTVLLPDVPDNSHGGRHVSGGVSSGDAAEPGAAAGQGDTTTEVSDDHEDSEDSTVPNSGKLSLSEQLMALHTGGTGATVDPDDFETNPIVREVFTHLDATYDYQDPEGFSSPDSVHVTIETEGRPAGDDADADASAESVLVTWKPLPGRPRDTTLYRVIAADREVDRAPGAGHELVITHGTAFRDTRPATSGFRHYMVWAYTWDDGIENIYQAPALFLGEDVAIFPPRNFKLAESGGIVTGSWDSLPGHAEVRVYHARKDYPGRLNDSGNQLTSGLEQSGFTHRVSTRGLTYLFSLAPVVSFRGRSRTGAQTPPLEKQVSAEIQKVTLTTAEPVSAEGEDSIMLSWQAPPTGTVRIYLTDSAPNPELTLQAIDKDYIDDDDALGTTDRIVDDDTAPGQAVLRKLVWPAGWHQVYATPVNIVEERAWVGESAVLQKVDTLRDPRLIERVSSQLVTFDWPGGADFVDITTTQQTVRLEETAYRRQGGVRLNLLNSGERISLMPKAIYDGEEKEADEAAVIDYPGLRTFSYDLDYTESGLLLKIWSLGYPDANAPHFRLVYRPDRLPLALSDGEPVTCMKYVRAQQQEVTPSPDIYQATLPGFAGNTAVAPTGDGTWLGEDATGEALWWVDNRNLRGGYLRLFIDDRYGAGAGGHSREDDGQSTTWGTVGAGVTASAFGGALHAAAEPPTGHGGGTGGSDGDGAGVAAGARSGWTSSDIPAVIIEGEVAGRLTVPRADWNGAV